MFDMVNTIPRPIPHGIVRMRCETHIMTVILDYVLLRRWPLSCAQGVESIACHVVEDAMAVRGTMDLLHDLLTVFIGSNTTAHSTRNCQNAMFR